MEEMTWDGMGNVPIAEKLITCERKQMNEEACVNPQTERTRFFSEPTNDNESQPHKQASIIGKERQ